MEMNRRDAICLAAGTVAAGATLLSGCKEKPTTTTTKKTKSGESFMNLSNDHFYNADGSFNTEKAKEAFYAMMEHYNHPIVDRLKGEEFWAVDFGLGRFAEVGMAGIFWINNLEDNYFGHEIYLLPGQRIPEHSHVKTDITGPKMEAWQVRNGMIYTYAEGTPTPGAEDDIPEAEKEFWIAKTRTKLMPGELAKLEKAETMHWMMAGPDGAIVTEYATYHDGNALRFSNPNVKF